MSRGGRRTVAFLLGAACMFFRAGAVTPTGLELDIVWSTGIALAAADRAAITERAPLVVPTAPEQWFHPSGRNLGTEALVNFLARLALRDNAPLYLSESWGRTTGEPTSDHHISRSDSWACDLAVRGVNVPSDATARAAQRISSALGEPRWRGGSLVKVVAGYRFQVLWLVPGHFDHVHVGVRKIG